MKLLKLLLLTSCLILTTYNSESTPPILNSFDESGIPPSGFRMSHTIVLPTEKLNTKGLEELNISGSSQFSKMGLKTLVKKINRKKITILNLREEDVGFIEPAKGTGGFAFSYFSNHPTHRSVEEIEASEKNKLKKILQKKSLTLYGAQNTLQPSHQLEVSKKIKIIAKRVLTEKELVEKEGLQYLRIPNKKHSPIRHEEVDTFTNFIKTFPESEWLHFHDESGGYRSTLYMTMYDMIRNAKHVSALDIIKRQGPSGLGGIDLDEDALKFLSAFHSFVLSGSEKSWSQWAMDERIPQPEKKALTFMLNKPNFPNEDQVYHERTLILNTITNSALRVHNFRTTQDTWLLEDEKFNASGLKGYKASGSSQYIADNLRLLAKELKQQAEHVVIIDLRPDDHLFVNGEDVCSFETKDVLLALKTDEEIKNTRQNLKQLISSKDWVQLNLIDTKYPRNNFDLKVTMTVQPSIVLTPQELVESFGLEYVSIAHNRFSDIENVNIDKIIDLAKSSPKDTWFHFHCKKGKSRTTLYMTLFDTLHNADKATLEEIIYRQKFIGGSDILDITPRVPSWKDEKDAKKKWIVFLARFHKYSKENIETNFEKSWSTWSEENKDYQPNVDHLVYDKNEGKYSPNHK